jgi:hypothetical protein
LIHLLKPLQQKRMQQLILPDNDGGAMADRSDFGVEHLSNPKVAWPPPVSTTPHVVWLRQRRIQSEEEKALQKMLEARGISVEITYAFEVTSATLAKADLVLINAGEEIVGAAELLVTRVRLESLVPIAMLASHCSPNDLVTALCTGADAIWTLDMPPKVLYMHCLALLRRARLPRYSSS